MDPKRWQQLKSILADALEQTSGQKRTAVMKRSCGDDTTLLRDAKELLAFDTRGFEHVAEFAGADFEAAEPDRNGERLGAYVIIRELGRGGMGAVYLAQRADGQFEKLVAIKILKRGMDTDEVLRRFRNERQILANLDHGNISRLLDGGVTGDGLPYFVMEFIEGTPITRFVQREHFDLNKRLRLFLKVCSAVAVAHRNFTIHRDIKPGNVLVRDDGEPKLLDFGIATLLNGDREREITVAVERRFTPVYAAPEQGAGKPVTVATDIYSLGALLYELVTGRSPRDWSGCGNIRPTPEGWKETLPKELKRIIKRAMRTQPIQRYSSVSDFASDIEHYLGQTTSQDSGAKVKRSGRQISGRRHRYWSITATAGGIVLLIAALGLFRGKVLSPKSYFFNHDAAPVGSVFTPEHNVHSIAVLPFEPLDQNKNGNLLGLGMADAVIGRMSNLKQLLVMPTSAVLKYKGRASDPLAAAHALHVDAILTGTVQESADKLRISVQLVSSSTGRMLWSKKFDQRFTDIFAIQDSISDKVARSLVRDLSEEQQQQLSKHYTNDTVAYDSYVMGVYFWNQRSRESLEKAIDYFQQAVQLDPDYALAYAVMADCYFLQGYYGFTSPAERMGRAKWAAERALQLDDTVAEGYVAAAMVDLYEDGDHVIAQSVRQAAMEKLRRAIVLKPNLAVARQRYAWLLSEMGRLNDAVVEMKRAQELDPLSPTNNTALGVILVFSRQFQQALDYCRKAAELDPTSAPIQENLAFAYALNGMYQNSIDHYQKEAELSPDKKDEILAQMAVVLVTAGRNSEAEHVMRHLADLSNVGKLVDPYIMTLIFTARGENDRAFEWFDKTLATKSLGVRGLKPMIRYDPLLDPLRPDERFQALLRKHDLAWLTVQPEGEEHSISH